MDERAFYRESQAVKPVTLNCPYCRIADTYELVVACTLPTSYNCVFHLTWNATY